MRLRTLICCSLFVLTAHSQTKDAEFKKVENFTKKAKGLSTADFKIIDQAFSENSIKLEAVVDGKNGTLIYTNLDWDNFDYSVEKLEGNDKIAKLVISFDEKVDLTIYENKKQMEKGEEDELLLYIYAADEKLVKQQLEELQAYTWASLKELRTADKDQLNRFITKNLNAALEGEAKVKSITDCEIAFVFDNGKEMTVPTKGVNLHSKELIGTDYLFCYGKKLGVIKTKENSGGRSQGSLQSKSMEHPDIELDFEDDDDSVQPLEYAIKRLSAFCRL